MVKKHRAEGNKFDTEEFNRDLIRRVAGTREGTSIMMAMLTEMYLHLHSDSGPQALEEMIDQNLTGMSTAEDKAENKHFIIDE